MADLGGGGCAGRTPPPMGPNSFIFAYIFTEKHPCRRSTPPSMGNPGSATGQYDIYCIFRGDISATIISRGLSNVPLQLALWLRPSYCVTLCYEEEPPLPRSTPQGAYRSTSIFDAVYLFLQSPLCHHHSYTHLHKADRSPVVGHIPTDHALSFMCINHQSLITQSKGDSCISQLSPSSRTAAGQ